MDEEKAAIVVGQLADSLGTNAEHLWGILVAQAPIAGTTYLMGCVALLFASVVAVRGARNMPRSTSLEETDRAAAWIGAIALMGITGLFVVFSIEEIVAAFFNPEYWALNRLLQ